MPSVPAVLNLAWTLQNAFVIYSCCLVSVTTRRSKDESDKYSYMFPVSGFVTGIQIFSVLWDAMAERGLVRAGRAVLSK